MHTWGNGIWSTERETTRGGADARAFNLEAAQEGHWGGKLYPMPLSHGREFSEDEIWDNYAPTSSETASTCRRRSRRDDRYPSRRPTRSSPRRNSEVYL